jgi:hypothetical protein
MSRFLVLSSIYLFSLSVSARSCRNLFVGACRELSASGLEVNFAAERGSDICIESMYVGGMVISRLLGVSCDVADLPGPTSPTTLDLSPCLLYIQYTLVLNAASLNTNCDLAVLSSRQQ